MLFEAVYQLLIKVKLTNLVSIDSSNHGESIDIKNIYIKTPKKTKKNKRKIKQK